MVGRAISIEERQTSGQIEGIAGALLRHDAAGDVTMRRRLQIGPAHALIDFAIEVIEQVAVEKLVVGITDVTWRDAGPEFSDAVGGHDGDGFRIGGVGGLRVLEEDEVDGEGNEEVERRHSCSSLMK
jgi:hypothetical protein